MDSGHTNKAQKSEHSSLRFDINLLGHEGEVVSVGKESPQLFLHNLPYGRNAMPIYLSNVEYALLHKTSKFGSVDLTGEEKGALKSLSYTIKQAEEESPNVLEVSSGREYENNLRDLYTLPCLGPYPQLLRIRCFKYSNNRIEIEDACTDMVASNIRYVKVLLLSLLRKRPVILEQFSYDPFDELLGRGLSTIPKAMNFYDISKGIEFKAYLRTAVLREIAIEYGSNRGLTNLPINPERDKNLDHKTAGVINTLLNPVRFYTEEGEEKSIPDLKVSVEDQVNMNLLAWILSRNIPHLKKQDALLLRKYYIEGLEQEEIGKELGVTKQRVSQKLTEAQFRLKRVLASKYGEDISISTFV